MVGIIIIGMKVISIARVKGKSISVGFGSGFIHEANLL